MEWNLTRTDCRDDREPIRAEKLELPELDKILTSSESNIDNWRDDWLSEAWMRKDPDDKSKCDGLKGYQHYGIYLVLVECCFWSEDTWTEQYVLCWPSGGFITGRMHKDKIAQVIRLAYQLWDAGVFHPWCSHLQLHLMNLWKTKFVPNVENSEVEKNHFRTKCDLKLKQ